MTAPLEVRDGRAEDADDVARIHVRSWQTAYRGLIDQDVLDSLSIPDRAANWRRFIAEPLPTGLGILVAVRDDRILGWASFGSGRDEDGTADGEIYGIYADPDAWSTGVGHALLMTAAERIMDATTHAPTCGCSTATTAPMPSTHATDGSSTAPRRWTSGRISH